MKTAFFILLTFVSLTTSAEPNQEASQNSWEKEFLMIDFRVIDSAKGLSRPYSNDEALQPQESVIAVITVFAKPKVKVFVQRACDRYHPKLGINIVPEDFTFPVPASGFASLTRILDPLPGRSCSLLVQIGNQNGVIYSMFVNKTPST